MTRVVRSSYSINFRCPKQWVPRNTYRPAIDFVGLIYNAQGFRVIR